MTTNAFGGYVQLGDIIEARWPTNVTSVGQTFVTKPNNSVSVIWPASKAWGWNALATATDLGFWSFTFNIPGTIPAVIQYCVSYMVVDDISDIGKSFPTTIDQDYSGVGGKTHVDGNAVPNVRIWATNADSLIQYETYSDDNGDFKLALTDGTYTLSFYKTNFSRDDSTVVIS